MSGNQNQRFYDWVESMQPLINFASSASKEEIIATFTDTSLILREENTLDALNTEINNLTRYQEWLELQLDTVSKAKIRLATISKDFNA